MSSKRRSIIVAVLLVVVVIAYLVSSRFMGSNSEVNVKIGSVLILEGKFKSYGEQFQEGARIAEAELKSNGTQNLELIILDSEGNKELALDRVKSLKDQYGIRFIADVMGTDMLAHVIPFIKENSMLVLSGVNTGPELSGMGYPFCYRIIPSDGVASEQLARWAIESGYTRAAVLHATDQWGTGLKLALERSYTERQGNIVFTKDVELDQTIFQPILLQLKKAAPDVVFLVLYPKSAGLLLKEARKQNIQTIFMGTENLTGTEVQEFGREAIDSVRFVVPQAGGGETEQLKHFHELFRARNGDAKPELFHVMGYDVVKLLTKAYIESGGDPVKASSLLAATRYEGASGPITFDNRGDVGVRDYARKMYMFDRRRNVAETVDVK